MSVTPKVRRAAAIATLTVAAGVGFAATAAADGPYETGRWEDRADRLCERIPSIQKRVDNLLTRFQADVDTHGSIAWLTERAERAHEEGHEDLGTFLEHRVTIRIERIDVLNARKDALLDAEFWCDQRADEP